MTGHLRIKITPFRQTGTFFYLCRMSRSVLFLISACLFFSACEEVPPYIDFTRPEPVTYKPKDTTYVDVSVPVAQHKAVLIEDVTGVRCNNCPRAAQKAMDLIAAKTSDSVVVVALYSGKYNVNFTTPYPGFPVLNSVYSDQVVGSLGVPNALPSGYVDRKKFGTQTVRYNSDLIWGDLVNQQLGGTSPVSIEIDDSLSGRELIVVIRLDYSSAVSASHKYSLFLTESGIVSRQLTTTQTDDNYIHNHVLRHAFGNATGNPVSATLVPGRVYIREHRFIVPADWNIAKCQLVCLVSDAGTEEVVNVREVHVQ